MLDLGLDVLFKGKNMARLLGGLGVALKISAVSVIISLPLGILLGVLMTSRNPVIKAVLRLYLEFVRIMPQMVLLFLVYFGTTRAFGWNLSGETASIIVFVLWGTAEMSDLVRGALIAIPKHQYESAEALGMSRAQTYWYIIIPQTVRRLIPLSINLITRMIKTTSLVPHRQPQRRFWHLSHGFRVIFLRMLAHQSAGILSRKEMEVTVHGRTYFDC